MSLDRNYWEVINSLFVLPIFVLLKYTIKLRDYCNFGTKNSRRAWQEVKLHFVNAVCFGYFVRNLPRMHEHPWSAYRIIFIKSYRQKGEKISWFRETPDRTKVCNSRQHSRNKQGDPLIQYYWLHLVSVNSWGAWDTLIIQDVLLKSLTSDTTPFVNLCNKKRGSLRRWSRDQPPTINPLAKNLRTRYRETFSDASKYFLPEFGSIFHLDGASVANEMAIPFEEFYPFLRVQG